MIRHYITWQTNHTADERLSKLVNRASVAGSGASRRDGQSERAPR